MSGSGAVAGDGGATSKPVVASGPCGQVVLLDSITQVTAEDAGRMAVSGSHGGVSSGRFALDLAPLKLAVFNDAGGGKDGAGIAALDMLQARGVAGATVSHTSARIGDARDTWDHGLVSHANEAARALGVLPGQRLSQVLRRLVGGSPTTTRPQPHDTPEETAMSTDIGASVRARAPYQSIVNRPRLRLPGDARVVVWNIVNVEVWEPTGPMPRAVLSPPMGAPLLPDVPNWAWHEYGMRVGFWRLLDAIRSRGMPATFALNGQTCEVYEEVCRAALDAGWEFMGHGHVQRPMHRVEDQRAAIRQTIAAIRRFTGKAPRGWESPGLTETDDTLDFLAECGIEYVADWVFDDQPVALRSPKGRITSVPYTVELNDVVISAVQQQPSDEILRRGKAHFDRLYRDGATQPRVMAISVHPYLSGVPHRTAYVEELYDYVLGHEGVLVWTGEQILDWFLAQSPAGSGD